MPGGIIRNIGRRISSILTGCWQNSPSLARSETMNIIITGIRVARLLTPFSTIRHMTYPCITLLTVPVSGLSFLTPQIRIPVIMIFMVSDRAKDGEFCQHPVRILEIHRDNIPHNPTRHSLPDRE